MNKKLKDCLTKEEKINWYTNACIGYLIKYEADINLENEFGKAEYCIYKIKGILNEN